MIVDISTNSFEILFTVHSNPKVTSLFIYPLKSAQGIACKSLDVVPTGPRHDREWMLIDANGSFISQRVKPQMSQIQTSLSSEHLSVSAEGYAPLAIPLNDWGSGTIEVKIFNKYTTACWLGSTYDEWFSDFLGAPVRLVRSPQERSRETSGNHGPVTELLFPDGYPFLLTNTATLAELNALLPAPITMQRFRPNIIVEGVPANEEDQWQSLRIGAIEFLSVKACTRCVIINIDPLTGEKSNTVTKTLATYRTQDGAVIFGRNLTHLNSGTLSVGDSLQV